MDEIRERIVSLSFLILGLIIGVEGILFKESLPYVGNSIGLAILVSAGSVTIMIITLFVIYLIKENRSKPE